MAELLFPGAALLLTFAVLVPLFTAVVRLVLRYRRRQVSWAGFGSDATFAWLVAPALLPIGWLGSSVIHQVEPLRLVEACRVDHATAVACVDAALLLGLLVLGGGTWLWWRLGRELRAPVPEKLPPSAMEVRRVRALQQMDRRLVAVPIRVVRNAVEPVYTVGWWRPEVVVDARFVRGTDEALLRAALLHECAHVVGRDPLMDLIARLALEINPVGWMLREDYLRWRSAREALRDAQAIQWGGEPLALAQGIVRAVRFGRGVRAGLTPLGGDHHTLRLRLALLFDGPPRPDASRAGWVLLVAVGVVVALPHLGGTSLLELLHLEVERWFHPLL